jgi:hypothetical protein
MSIVKFKVESEDPNHHWDYLVVKDQVVLDLGCGKHFLEEGMQTTPEFFIGKGAKKIIGVDPHIDDIRYFQEKLPESLFIKDCILSADHLDSYMNNYDVTAVKMDIEGHEKVLLDLNVVPELSKCTILAETHDCFVPNITNILCERFSDTHTIEIISQGAKNPYIDILFELPDTDKMVLCCETRPQTSYWLFLVPKSLESIK